LAGFHHKIAGTKVKNAAFATEGASEFCGGKSEGLLNVRYVKGGINLAGIRVQSPERYQP